MADKVLKEDSDVILLETGDSLLLEGEEEVTIVLQAMYHYRVRRAT